MKIGINALYLRPGKVGGTQTYADGMLSQISSGKSKHAYYVFCGKDYAKIIKEHRNIKIIEIPFVANNRFLRIIIEQIILPFYISKFNIHTLHSLGYTCPFYLQTNNIVTIHDLNWYYHPENFTIINRFVWKVFVTLSAKFSNHIITDSLASQQSLNQVLNIPIGKITVVYPGSPDIKLSNRATKLDNRVASKYILTVTSLMPHKNVYSLLKAFKKIIRDFPNHQLVIVGLGGVGDDRVYSYIKNTFKKNEVLVLGWVNNQTLSLLYENCDIFVFTSTYEGFGFPILEAFFYKAPVVSSKSYSLAEITGNAVEEINPHSISDISRGIVSVLGNPSRRRSLIAAGTRQRRQFSWSNFLTETENVYNKIFTNNMSHTKT